MRTILSLPLATAVVALTAGAAVPPAQAQQGGWRSDAPPPATKDWRGSDRLDTWPGRQDAWPGQQAERWGGRDLQQARLYDAWPVSELIGDTFVDRDGNAIGSVRDVLLTRGGDVAGLLVHREGTFGGNDYAVSWSQVSTSPGASAVRSRLGQETLENQARVDTDALARRGVVGAQSILGTTVNLADASGFGRVRDLLIDPQQDRLVGYAVSGARGGASYALPFDGSTFDTRDGSIRMPYDRGTVGRLQPWD